MIPFLADITDDTPSTYTVVVLDESSMGQARQYEVRPRILRYALFGTMFATVLLVSLVFLFTPIIELVPGRGSADVRASARRTAVAIQRLEDSLAVQTQYVEQLKRLLTGGIIPDAAFEEEQEEVDAPAELPLPDVPVTGSWADHEQPAVPMDRLSAPQVPQFVAVAATRNYISSLRLPVRPPVDGYLTRGFSARGAHFAVDIAVPTGTPVQSIGDGHVIFADWTNDGGYTIMVQHADGYLSVHKHNERLLKRVGDRIRDREAIAISGNSGELTSGPHIHFELWHNGLAQDPQQYFIQ